MNRSGSTKRLFVLACIGFGLFVWLNWFPPLASERQLQSEMQPALTKAEAAGKAKDFIQANLAPQLAAGKAQTFVQYDAFADESGYLLKEKLLAEYNAQWGPFVPLEHFRVEVRDPDSGTVYSVLVGLYDGRVFGFETSPSASDDAPLDEAASAALARATLASLGYDTGRFAAAEAPPGEHRFVHPERVGEASLALRVRTHGERVTGVVPEISLPGAYASWKKDQDSRGVRYGLLGLLLWLLIAVAALVVLAVFRKDMIFSRGTLLTLCFLIPYAMHNINLYPGIRLSYADEPEAIPFGILFSQFITVLMAVSVYVCLVAGDGLWRRMGHRLWPRLGDPEFGSELRKGMGRGYLLAFVVLGVQSLLFFSGSVLFDVWSTSDPLESTHNLLEPGVYPLLAWSAGISEEAVFRMFALAFFSAALRPLARWLYRWTGRGFFNNPVCYIFPAALITSAVWALGHAGYAVYPVYTRLVEVTVLGLIFAYAFLRFGWFTALFAHATVDILIMALQIMATGGEYAGIGLLYPAMPAAVAFALDRLTRRVRPHPLPHPH